MLSKHNYEEIVRIPKIEGEYYIVSIKTREYILLSYAHSITMYKEDALELIKLLCIRYNISFANGTWKFKEGVRAKGGARWKKIKYKNGKVKYTKIREAVIVLPSIPLIITGTPYGLTLGLVLHEFAHVIQHYIPTRYKDLNHGKDFVNILDNLVRYYHENIDTINRERVPLSLSSRLNEQYIDFLEISKEKEIKELVNL